MTVQDIIVQALRKIGVLAAGETGAADEMADGFNTVNALLDQWQAERLQMFEVLNATVAMTPGKQLYTVGFVGGADFLITRPTYIDHVNFINTSSSPPLEMLLSPLNDDAWSKVPQKLLTSPFPTCWFYRQDYPQGSLLFWPIPTSTTLTASLYYAAPILIFSSLTQIVSFPPGYQRMLISNLAAELIPEYGVNPQTVPGVLQQAAESKAVVKTSNVRILDLSVDAAVLPGQNAQSYYSILSGP